MAAPNRSAQARADWDHRIGRRRGPGLDPGGPGRLTPPGGLRAVPGRGHVMLDWEPVPGAAGYLVHRADDAAGPFEPLDHGGGDVLAVPAGPYADTSGDGRVRYYAVAAVADGESAGPLSGPVAATPDPGGTGVVAVEVGSRTLALAQRVVHQVTQMLAPGCVPLFLTDGLKDYATALLTHFGQWMHPERRQDKGPMPKPRWMPLPELLYAQVVKSYRRRRIVGVKHRVVFGTQLAIEQI